MDRGNGGLPLKNIDVWNGDDPAVTPAPKNLVTHSMVRARFPECTRSEVFAVTSMINRAYANRGARGVYRALMALANDISSAIKFGGAKE
jgi:hypothetical protein